jgi:murein DD-endopeptidase MepM/ murein hydrolase activator NlpD
VVAQPLPAPTRPATVAASGYGTNYGTGYASGAPGLGAYRPRPVEATGSVPAYHPPAPAPVAPPPPSGHWTWDGGAAVVVGHNESLEAIARRHGVPMHAIMQVNHLASASAIRPGQHLVIPRYVPGGDAHVASARPMPAPAPAPAPAVSAPRAGGGVHVVAPGETMMVIAHHYGVTLTALAHANNMKPFGTISIGQRLNIPAGGTRKVALAQPAPGPAPLRPVAPRAAPPIENVGSVPTQNARVVTPEPVHAANEHNAVKTAEPVANAMPAFRWPVKGRVIAEFGQRINGAQNDGVNLAVPAGTPIKAAEDGVVAYAGNELKGYGNLVLIRHSNNFVSAYANASELMVKRGDTVKRGQVIAKAGQTGNVTSPQLHFEIRKGSAPVDPLKYLGG